MYIIFITKIDDIVKLSKNFDLNFKNIINLQNNDINEETVNNLYSLTKNYLLIRTNHGSLLLLVDNLKKSINLEENIDLDTENKLYELSTFMSILSNVNDLINNIDFQYKKIALKYPKFINKKPLQIYFFTDNIEDENNKYLQMVNNIKQKYPENIYKIVKCNKSDKKIKCDDIGLNIKIVKLPVLYIVNGSSITEIPTDKIKNEEQLSKLIS